MDVARSQRSSGVRSQHQPAISSGENEVDNVLSESLLTPLAGEFGTHIDRIPPKRSTVLGMAIVPMTSGEEERTIADVYGRNPPEAALVDERLNALEREVGRLKREERSSLENALRHHPLLTVASPHVRAMIREEDYDAPSAARRLARYWRQRESLFGSRAFSTDIFTQPDFDDYMCHYNRCLRSMHDLELDGEMRYMAREYVSIVNRVKIEAMDKLIDEAPEKDREALMEARRVNPEVAQSDEHKILFLKCEDLVEASAAVRMMKYWEMKKLLFGPDKLGKEITLADVETSVFESDVIVHSLLVPDTDEAGRCVFWVNGKELAREGWTADGVVS
uniref:Uncharacterized protein n=1 Tax=Odontella aurita TaxID=265563 RepID=A0A7S4K411_9STRA|mmetsp:Transcript_60979/g.180503  ORF Transcript_60979/g.180503 Transcript_60979/m.180503 type:complete len:335 (+) Transcript_60979:165-1169(+)|eukprot:CAMPEP_0113531028 /NCGR_PEP_ID=MMETSP0015_2-20120614/3272_1 /TAXON_ID=2838 /ORGANISM="Odontella" /LENGTH=334 /DNA_ID=CAMNT_0000429825 /DNA_START=107 /DNA_END=1111 /DNA_ORIENTATION=- /assembly_acc=CAM_ASM_000160